MDRHTGYATLASGILGGAGFVELAHVVHDRPIVSFEPTAAHAISVILAVGYFAAALCLELRRKSLGLATAAWMLGILAPLLMGFHGALTMWAGNELVGLLLVGAAFVVGLGVKRTFDRGELVRMRRVDPRHLDKYPPAIRS